MKANRQDSLQSTIPKSTHTDALIREIWERSLPIVRSRLDLLNSVGLAATRGGLPPAIRTEAARTAHNLAGSLGMFGFGRGTHIARELEAVLSKAQPTPPESKLIHDLACQLRETLDL